MSGLPSATLTEAQGFVAAPADLDRLAVVLTSACSQGSGLSAFFFSGASAAASVGYGDGTDTLAQIIEQRQAGGANGLKFPAAAYVMPKSTPGAYLTLDTSGFTGTAVVGIDSGTEPYGTYDAAFRVMKSGDLGTPGVTYQTALDYEDTWSNTTALLVATSVTIPRSNVKFTFSLAPIVGTTDATDGSLYGGGGSLDTLTIDITIGGVNNVLTLSVGGNAASSAALLAAIHTTWPTITATIVSTNLVLTTTSPAITIGAGTANTLLGLPADDYKATLTAGDIIRVRTLAPAPSTDDIDAAATALANAPGDFALIVCEFPVTSSNFANITSLLNTLASRGKEVTALVRTRPRNFDLNVSISGVTNANPAVITIGDTSVLTNGRTYHIAGVVGATGVNGNQIITIIDGTTFSVPVAAGGAYTSGGAVTEDDAAWNANVSAEFASLSDDRIVVRAAYGLLTDALTTRQYLRSTLAQLAADTVRVERYRWPGAPADQAEANVSLSDSTGSLVGHDEGVRGDSTGLSDDGLGNRFSTEFRLPDPLRREAVFNAVPWTLYAEGSRIRNLMTRRVANAMKREAQSAAMSSLGGVIFYTPADPKVPGSRPTLTDASRNAVHSVIFNALSSKFADDIQNADNGDVDTGLVQINPVITVTGGNLINIEYELAPLVLGYLLKLSGTLAVQE